MADVIGRFGRLLWLLVPDIETAVRRFPLAVAASGVLCVGAAILEPPFALFVYPMQEERRLAGELVATGLAAVFWLTAVALAVERGVASRRVGWVLGLGGSAAMGGLVLASQTLPHLAGYDAAKFMLASLLTLPVAAALPFSGHDANRQALRTVIAGFAAAVLALVLLGGLLAMSLNTYLEGSTVWSRFDGLSYPSKTNAIALGLLYLFNWLPLPPVAAAASAAAAFTNEFSRRLVVPLAMLILVISGYLFIRAVGGGHGNGSLARMHPRYPLDLANSLLLFGLVPYLLFWPMPGKGSPIIRLFVRGWPLLVALPLAFVATALFQALNPWADVNDRLAGAMFGHHTQVTIGLCAAVVTVAALLSPRFSSLKWPTATLAAALALASFGPWGAIGSHQRSKFRQLELALSETGLLVDGRIISEGAIPAGKPCSAGPWSPCRITMSFALQALADTRGLPLLKPWFAGAAADPFRQAAAMGGSDDPLLNDPMYHVHAALLRRFAPTITPEMPAERSVFHFFQFSLDESPSTVSLAGFRTISGPLTFGLGPRFGHRATPRPNPVSLEVDGQPYQVHLSKGQLTLTRTAGGEHATFDFGDFVAAAIERQEASHIPGKALPPAPSALVPGTGSLKAAVLVRVLEGSVGPTGEIAELRGEVLVLTGAQTSPDGRPSGQ